MQKSIKNSRSTSKDPGESVLLLCVECDALKTTVAGIAGSRIANARVLVTGASGGLGRALSLEMAARGANLVVVARRQQELDELASEIHASGRRCETVVGDITDAEVRRAALVRASSAFGGLDVLINNAGVGAVGLFANATPDRLRQVMELNFFALAELTRAALPLLKQGRRPMVVNIGSILSYRAVPGSSEYCASKFAVRGLTQSLRAELRPMGIDVLLVSPAGTESQFWQHLLEKQGEPALRGRPASAELVARRIARAIERGTREVFPTWSAWFVQFGERLAPGLLEWFVARRGPCPPPEENPL